MEASGIEGAALWPTGVGTAGCAGASDSSVTGANGTYPVAAMPGIQPVSTDFPNPSTPAQMGKEIR